MKIYTGGGDRGKTSLFSGERVRKDHSRIQAYGDADELNSILGALIAALPEKQQDIINEDLGLKKLRSWKMPSIALRKIFRC
jgi:cob(I)alamin adenosyltransferase